MPSVETLTGSSKISSDLISEKVKIRWNEAPSIMGGNNKKIQFKLPKLVGKSIDMSSISIDFRLEASAATELDSWSTDSLLSRVRFVANSTVLLDIDQYSLYGTTTTHAEINQNFLSKHQRMLTANFKDEEEATNFSTQSRRVQIKFPEGCLLNCSALLPLDRLAGFCTLELYLADPNKILFSRTAVTNPWYKMTVVQFLATYLGSPSLTNYWSSAPVSFHVENISHRFQNMRDTTNILRIPSAFTSLRSMIILLRKQARVDAGVDVAKRSQSFIVWDNIASIQVFSNNRPVFSEELTYLGTELYGETKKVYKHIDKSTYFTGPYDNGIPIAISFDSAPVQFHSQITSGIQTKAHVSDLYVNLKYNSGIEHATNMADVFLVNDSKIFVNSNNNLEIEY